MGDQQDQKWPGIFNYYYLPLKINKNLHAISLP